MQTRGVKRKQRLSTGLWNSVPFLAPATILYSIFLLAPVVVTFWLSFQKWNGFKAVPTKFVGLQNYRQIFGDDPVFYTALKNSLIWVCLSLLIPTVLGLILALSLNQKLFGRNLLRSIFYLPAVLASIAVATMWTWLYNPDYGLINTLLTKLGKSNWALQWLGEPKIALYSIFVAFIWQSTGFGMVLFLAGLQQVPAELLDAAHVDGANGWQRFKNVILPSLRPTTVVVIALTIINSLKVFDLIYGMTQGGPAQSTQVLALWSYYQSFGNHTFGMGSALSVILLLLSLVLVVPYLIWTLKGEKDE